MGLPYSASRIVTITTTGDRVQDRALRHIGGKGVFCREIEQALLADSIDVAVHSLKDMPVQQPDGLVIDCFLRRQDPRDALISRTATKIAELQADQTVGTSSLRRRMQLLRLQPRLKVVDLRGNILTRLTKWKQGEVDHIILALAGIRRLGIDDFPVHPIPARTMLPAPGQGIICLERRCDDGALREAFRLANDTGASHMAAAERGFLEALGGSCDLPVAALSELTDHTLSITGEFFPLGAVQSVSGSVSGPRFNAARLGTSLAKMLTQRVEQSIE